MAGLRFFLAPAASALLLAGCEEAPEIPQQSAEEVAGQLAEVPIEPGLWERRREIVGLKGENMPVDVARSAQGRTAVTTHCITPDQARRPQANFVELQENSVCTYRNFEMRDGRLQGTTTCAGGDVPGTRVIRMEGEYGPTRYDLRSEITSSGVPNEPDVTLQVRHTGRRVGPCAGEGGG